MTGGKEGKKREVGKEAPTWHRERMSFRGRLISLLVGAHHRHPVLLCPLLPLHRLISCPKKYHECEDPAL